MKKIFNNKIAGPFINLHINPQKFNLDTTGFTLVATPSEIAHSLITLPNAQLRSILRILSVRSDYAIYDKITKNPLHI